MFSDSAPDIEEYKQYYESIDPADAEIIYRQVVEQTAANDEMDDYVKAYSSMKPKEAAAIFDTMTDNLQLVADILDSMGFLQKSGCRCSYGKGGREWETTMLQALGKC